MMRRPEQRWFGGADPDRLPLGARLRTSTCWEASMPPTETRVAIVGAGAAGLSAAPPEARRGLEPLLFDGRRPGRGTWARRYDRLHLHTVRRFSGSRTTSIPRTYPGYVPKDMFARYLREYADHFGLDVRLGHRASRVRPEGLSVADRGDQRRRVAAERGRDRHRPIQTNGESQTGWGSRLPAAESSTPADYRSGADLPGERVPVVGIGNSGAGDRGRPRRSRARPSSPSRSGRHRQSSRASLFGVVPVQLLGLACHTVPAPRLLDRVGAVLRRVGIRRPAQVRPR